MHLLLGGLQEGLVNPYTRRSKRERRRARREPARILNHITNLPRGASAHRDHSSLQSVLLWSGKTWRLSDKQLYKLTPKWRMWTAAKRRLP